MTIGLPRAFYFYRYGQLWQTFFQQLGCDVLVSTDTGIAVLNRGIRRSVDENCLPMKIFLGHVEWLADKCDVILLPRFENTGRDEEFCVRFFGLYDVVRSSFEELRLLQYNISASLRSEQKGFLQMGRALGKSRAQALAAYKAGKQAQAVFDLCHQLAQGELIKQQDGVRILIAAQPYIIHDAFMGETVMRLVREQGGTPIYSDYYDRAFCHAHASQISKDLYWTMNKEIVGAVACHRHEVDGILLLTAFPCGTDSLVNELVLRRVKDVPVVQIMLDEQQGEAGLRTRIESFLDILKQRKQAG